MARKKNNFFKESADRNNITFIFYLNRLVELALSRFEWINLPDTVDARYLESALLYKGMAVYFRDDVIGDLALNVMYKGMMDVYGNPTKREAYSIYNHYRHELDESNSVVVWNDYLREPYYTPLVMYATKLANIDRTIDVNVSAQKTPVLVLGSDQQKLTLQNLYKEYDGNAPVIFGYKNLDIDSLTVLKTDAPYVADKLQQLKTEIFNEVLTFLGISNVSIQKRERLITDEVTRSEGGTLASRYAYVQARQTAVDEINRMFDTNIEVRFKSELDVSKYLTDILRGNQSDYDVETEEGEEDE